MGDAGLDVDVEVDIDIDVSALGFIALIPTKVADDTVVELLSSPHATLRARLEQSDAQPAATRVSEYGLTSGGFHLSIVPSAQGGGFSSVQLDGVDVDVSLPGLLSVGEYAYISSPTPGTLQVDVSGDVDPDDPTAVLAFPIFFQKHLNCRADAR